MGRYNLTCYGNIIKYSQLTFRYPKLTATIVCWVFGYISKQIPEPTQLREGSHLQPDVLNVCFPHLQRPPGKTWFYIGTLTLVRMRFAINLLYLCWMFLPENWLRAWGNGLTRYEYALFGMDRFSEKAQSSFVSDRHLKCREKMRLKIHEVL